MWYIVIVCSKDWYTLYGDWYAVKYDGSATIEIERGLRRRDIIKQHEFIEAVIGPFKHKPKDDGAELSGRRVIRLDQKGE